MRTGPVCLRSSWTLHLCRDGFHTVLLIVGAPDLVLIPRRVGKDMGRRQQRGDRRSFDFADVIDEILWPVRRPNPVSDHRILVIAWRQYQRAALESITAPLEDIHYVNFDGGIAIQVQYCPGRCDV